MGIWAKWLEQDGRYHYSLTDNGGLEISAERHLSLLDAGSAGKWVRPGANGAPEITDPLPPDDEVLKEKERAWRNAELQAYEWLVTRHRDEQDLNQANTLTAQQFVELLSYRQALREWPQSDSFFNEELRPARPDWLNG